MTTKVVKITKQIALFSVLFLGILSCEKEIENVGVNIVDNGIFERETYNSEVISYNQDVLKRRANQNASKRRADDLARYLLGVYRNADFGKLDASIVTQLAPLGVIDFGVDPSIDTVIVQIPYQRIDTNSHTTTAALAIDLIGDESVEYNLNIYELDEYLNTLDPTNPSEELGYFTDQTYNYNPTALYSGLFSPDNNDTVLYVKRPEVILDFATMEHDIDTLLLTGSAPSMKIPLNEDFFTNNFLPPADFFTSVATFIESFNGLYIQATPATTSEASIMLLDISNESSLRIYYTNTVITDETITDAEGTVLSETDLNGDGDTTDEDVAVRTKQTAIFTFSGITTNTYIRDYAGSSAESTLNSPDVVNGDERLYLQGASGSLALINLFTTDDLQELRSNNWLINEANLTFYIDNTFDGSIVPERLFVYNYDEDFQISDIFAEGVDAFGGELEREGGLPDGLPIKYTINITDYVSDILKATDAIEPSKLAVKVYNPSDSPISISDIEVRDFSWTPRGIVLHGNQSSDVEKRIKLEIIYSKIN